MPVSDYNPYSTIKPLLGGSRAAWLADEEQQLRVASYDLYEQIYWGVPESFKLVQRGADDLPIYIPAGRTIVETLHRYLANEMRVIADPQFGTDDEQAAANLYWTTLARRERFYSLFNTNKRMGIVRGDWVFHMRGDPERQAGARISIETIHPGELFDIRNEEGDLIGWHIIAHVKEGDVAAIQRTTYFKETEMGGPSPIVVSVGVYEVDKWGGPGQDPNGVKLLRTVQPDMVLPAPIDQLPIYHIPNHQNDEFLWGSSELRGSERVLAAIDQSISDEELELVLTGLGCYATDMDKPINADGVVVDWDLGPGRVVQVNRGARFERVTGTTSVSPHQEHLKYLHEQLDQAAGTPAVAKGKVDVTVAESGVALVVQLGPLLARVAEKEQIVTDVVTNYLFDLSKWIVAYEGSDWNFLMESVRFVPIYGDKIPVNRKERFSELIAMATATPVPIIPLNVAWDELRKLGYELPPNDELLGAIIEQKELMGSAEADGMANRIDRELSQEEEQEPEPQPEEGQGEEPQA